jgi:hypothetical protein
MFSDHGLGHANNVMGMADQMQNLQGQAAQQMAQNTMDAWQRENDRRVAISREQRRMDHEKELQQMQIDAMLARLSQAQQPGFPGARFEGGSISYV